VASWGLVEMQDNNLFGCLNTFFAGFLNLLIIFVVYKHLFFDCVSANFGVQMSGAT